MRRPKSDGPRSFVRMDLIRPSDVCTRRIYAQRKSMNHMTRARIRHIMVSVRRCARTIYSCDSHENVVVDNNNILLTFAYLADVLETASSPFGHLVGHLLVNVTVPVTGAVQPHGKSVGVQLGAGCHAGLR